MSPSAADTPIDRPDVNSCALQCTCSRRVAQGSTMAAAAGIATSYKVILRSRDTSGPQPEHGRAHKHIFKYASRGSGAAPKHLPRTPKG
eukprot:5081249-Amphidinium_carterae.2